MPGPISDSFPTPTDPPHIPITCDAVRALVEANGKRWAVVISGTAKETQFTTWGKSAENKLYAADLSEYLSSELCPSFEPINYLESFHEKVEAARNAEELERLRGAIAGFIEHYTPYRGGMGVIGRESTRWIERFEAALEAK